MTAANCADIFANELLRSAHIHDLQIRVVQPRHHLFGRDRYCRIDFQFERDGRKLRGVTADRPAGGGPVLDAIMVDTDIAAAEILQGVKTEIGIPRAAAAVHDGFAIRVQTRRAEYLLDAVRRDEILGIFVAQNFRRIADADGARNVSFGICIGSSYVPNNGISRDSLGDIVAIDDGGGRGQGGLRPQERKRNEYQKFHDEPSVSSLLSSELSKTVYHLRVRVSSSNPINLGRAGPRTKVGNGSWLRDNALTQPATLHVPVNVVRHGRSEQFFPVERSGTASESSWGMLGKVWLEIGTQWGLHTHALIAASTALVPTIFMTRVRL